LEFAEIRSQKRVYGKDCEAGKLLEAAGIVDPTSGKILTVADAIKLHLLDIRTGEIVLISGERMSLEKAAEHRLIDLELANKLGDHLEAVRNELAEAENGNFDAATSEKRIKVTTTSIISASIESSTTSSSNMSSKSCNVKTIADAINDGTVDPIKGIYKLADGTISITEAYQRGLLIKNESVKLSQRHFVSPMPLHMVSSILRAG
jgi:dystonin